MPPKKVWLKAIKSRGKWMGDFACSICGERFRPDPNDIGRLQHEFDAHVKATHPGVSQREDTSQAAARIRCRARTCMLGMEILVIRFWFSTLVTEVQGRQNRSIDDTG